MPRLLAIHEHQPRYHLPELLSLAWLRSRGWSRNMVNRFAGAADALVANPQRAGARPMKFFLKSRIQEIEATDEFVKAKMKMSRRIKGVRNRKEGKMAQVRREQIMPQALWHTTKRENVASILDHGFKDSACLNTRIGSAIRFPSGVWVGDIPVLDDELFDGVGLFNFDAECQSFIEVRADASIQHHAEEWIDPTWPGRQWLVPAAVLNGYPRREASMDEVLRLRIKHRAYPPSRTDLSEWVQRDRGYAMEFVGRVRTALDEVRN